MDAVVNRETLGFGADVKQLLHLMIHSLYRNKDIFLRELLSNASDAADKLRFDALADARLFEDDYDLKIHVSFDAAARTITISDNGIGMSRQEAIDHIGTIARSGTREFVQQHAAGGAESASLIGQFGVGFYSAFIVADRVTVLTRRAGLEAADGVKWESGGEGDYTIEPIAKANRGTDVVLHLRPDQDDLLSGDRLRRIIRNYSDHISVPILMKATTVGDGATPAPANEYEQVNEASALWARPKSEITDAEYDEFYKHVAHDIEPPLARVHVKVEGRGEFTQLLFIPKRAPFDLWNRESTKGIRLYVRRVFVMDDTDTLLPRYLRFVRGVIDSSDLSLNVSREVLQQSVDVQHIKTVATKRVLGALDQLAAREPENFLTFWTAFGRVLKEGAAEDPANLERLAKLFRFASTQEETADPASLADYVKRMKEGQAAIYYITANSIAAARHSPHLEIFRKRGIEVLLLHDPIDEWVVASLHEFDGKPLRSVTKGDLALTDLGGAPAADEALPPTDEHRPLLDRMQAALKDRARDVRTSARLTESSACLVSDESDMSLNFQRLMKASGQQVLDMKPVLEINLEHPIIKRLEAERDDDRFAALSHTVFDQAALAGGAQLDDSAGFVRRLNALILALASEAAPRAE